MAEFNSVCKITSKVVRGNQLGRTVGMPTANFDLTAQSSPQDASLSLPPNGVYGSIVTLPDGTQKYGVTNIGPKPSVDDTGAHNVETHILDFDGDLYGQEITVDIVKHIRDIKKFDSLEEVKSQVDQDKLWI